MRRLPLFALALVLPGCGLSGMQDARNEYVKSTEKYDQCIAANRATPDRCETLRLAMEADGRKYNEVSPNFLDKMQKKEEQQLGGQYNECLAANRATPEKCEPQRAAVESERQLHSEQNKNEWAKIFRPGTPPPDYANAQH